MSKYTGSYRPQSNNRECPRLAIFAKDGRPSDPTMGFAVHAACARNQIFPAVTLPRRFRAQSNYRPLASLGMTILRRMTISRRMTIPPELGETFNCTSTEVIEGSLR